MTQTATHRKANTIPFFKKKFAIEQPQSLNLEAYERWLQEEQAFLNKQLVKIGQTESPSSTLDNLLKTAQTDLNKLSSENKRMLNSLEKKLDSEHSFHDGHHVRNGYGKVEPKSQRQLKEISSDINSERVYLRQTIYHLEQRQIADSIKRIGRSIKDDNGGS